MRIVAMRTGANAVGQYRVGHPMAALAALGHDTQVITLGREAERVSNAELLGDILILARQTNEQIFDLLATIPSERRPRLVYEIDDNPWEWHSWDRVHRELGFDYRRRVENIMRRCDAVICSTRTLAARIREELPETPLWVVPNAIDYQLRDWETREDRAAHGLEGQVILGWTGSIHHERDGQALLAALPDIFTDHPETVLLMQCDRSLYVSWTERLHRRGFGARLHWAPPVSFAVHPRVYSLFDVNLAPLVTSKFNVCKSDLRLIEGGAHGVPYVASNIAPYAEWHEQTAGIGGHLAASPQEWREAIAKLLSEREARGQSLARVVRETRSLAVVAGQWQAALQAIAIGHGGTPLTSRWAPDRNAPCPCGSGSKYKQCHVGVYG